MSFDQQIYQFVASWRGHSRILDLFMLLFEIKTLGYFLVALVLATFFAKSFRLQRAAIITMIAMIIVVGSHPLYKDAVVRDRPWVLYGCPGIATCYGDSSFPSGHAFLVGAMLVTLGVSSLRAGLLMGFVSICMSISRIYLGEHWPSDIVAGFGMGVLTGGLVTWVCSRQPMKDWIDHSVYATRHFRNVVRTKLLRRREESEAAPEPALETVVASH